MGSNRQVLDFRHATRATDDVVDELGRVLLVNVCSVVPGGVVLFLPSYGYEAEVVRRWKAKAAPGEGGSAAPPSLWEQLQGKKAVRREPRDARDLDAVLAAYASDAKRRDPATAPGGTPPLPDPPLRRPAPVCVVGGKMSEGINFADDMARGVVVAGLPFPDKSDPELYEKMAHLDRLADANKSAARGERGLLGNDDAAPSSLGRLPQPPPITGQAYYFNLCMRAVNQSVGRAIRHRADYAAIVLCDARYANDAKVWQALPLWIREGGGLGGGKGEKVQFGKVVAGMRQFFKEREGR